MSDLRAPSGRDLGVVVVGTSFGGRIQVPALRAAGFDVLALVGRDPERTEARARSLGVPRATTSVEEAVRLPGVRAVAVSTPPAAHHDAVLTALGARRHVLCEKPFALDAAEARRMVEAAEEAGVVHLIGTEFRWTPDEALVRRVIRSGLIGEPSLVTFVQHSPLNAGRLHQAFNPEWWTDAARGGGILRAAGVHVIDRLRTWMGEVASVSAHLQVVGNLPPGAADDTYTLHVRFASGAVGVLQHCASAWGQRSLLTRVFGPLGSIWTEGGEAWLGYRDGSHRLDVPPDLALPPAPAPSNDPQHAFTHLELPPYTRLAERFRDEILGIKPSADAPPTPTFLDGLAAQLVIDAADESSGRQGAWVDVPAA
jgi:predicted dehydrogenase